MEYTRILLIVMAFAVSLICGMLIIPLIVDFCKRKKLFDKPNSRKQHKTLIPRLGGVCFLPCMCISFFAATGALFAMDGSDANIKVSSFYLLAGAAMVYLIGLLDDVIEISAKQKLAVQIFSACWLIIAGLYFNNLYGLFGIWEIPSCIGMPLTVFFVVAVDNAMNLIDGIDGLCAGLCIVALAGFGVMFANIGLWVYCVLIAGLIGVLLAYSFFNMVSKKRKIFMGDSGSLTLGYLLAVFFVKLSMNIPWLTPYDETRMILASSFLIVPCLDVLRVMITRKRQHKALFCPDRNHIHHRLMDAGCTMRQALGVILLLDLGIIAMNVLFVWQNVQITFILILDILMFISFFYGLQRVKSK